MRSLSILIVENEAIAEDLAANVLQLGYDVAGTTATGEEAVETARKQRPALVLMDIRLAGAKDGITAAQASRIQSAGTVSDHSRRRSSTLIREQIYC